MKNLMRLILPNAILLAMVSSSIILESGETLESLNKCFFAKITYYGDFEVLTPT